MLSFKYGNKKNMLYVIMKILILMNIFFNYDMVKRTLKSIFEQNIDIDIDIIFLENPSKYSNEILELSKKYKIRHYKFNKNIGGKCFQKFITDNETIINNYDYICLTESDVILDKNVIRENINILEKNNGKICYTGLKVNLDKYNIIKNQINKWVPKKIIKESYCIGPTGFQFITFNKNYLLKFIKNLNNKKISSNIALGSKNYSFISDSNLIIFNNNNNEICYQTKYNLLEHIGWETAIGLNEEYRIYKFKNIKNIRSNINLDIIFYKLINF